MRGGRWKPLHYFFAAHLYTDLFAACGNDGRCFVKNDNPLNGVNLTAFVSLERYEDGSHIVLSNRSFSLPAGANSLQWFCAASSAIPPAACPTWNSVLPKSGCWGNGSDCLLNITLVESVSSRYLYSNQQLLNSPELLMPSLSHLPISFSIGNPSNGVVPITVTATESVLYVHLTTLASGRFSENSFSLVSTRSKTVQFIPIDSLNMALLTSSLRVEHLAQYLL